MRVGWDLDGVGYVFGNSVRMYLNSIGMDVPPATDDFCTNWNFFEFWGMDKEEFGAFCDAGGDAGYVFGDHPGLTRPNFFESIKRVKALGHENIVVTHRYQGSPGQAEANTYKWLAPVQNWLDEIHFSHDKTSVPTDTFVEDNLQNYDMLINKGVRAFLVDRPWNQVEGGDARMRIADVSDYADAVEQITIDGFADLTLA